MKLLFWALWKQSTYKLQLLFGTLWKQSTYTLQLLLGALWKQGTYQWCAWVIFVESESESWLGRVESEWSHKNCQVTSSHWFASSSQCRVTWNFTFFLLHFYTMKWRPTCYKMATDKLENGVQCCFNKFDCRLFMSKFSQFAFYLSFSLSVISKNLAQLCCKCCNHSVSVVLNVRFATNGMYVKNNTHIYVSQTSRNRMITN